MNPRTLAALGLLALAMGGFILFYERELPSTDERRELEKKIVPVEADEVTALTLRGPDHEIRLVKQEAATGDELAPVPAAWRLETPIDARAEASAVDGLISRLVSLEKSRTIEAIDEQQLGLAPPRASAVVEAGDRRFTVRIGADLPLSSDVVVQDEDRSVAYQVAGAGGLVDEMTRGADDWRDKSLFEAERADIESVVLESQGERLLLARRGDGEAFWLEAPIGDRADTQDVGGLLTTITGLEAAAFLDEPPAGVELGLGEPQVVEVRLAGQEDPWRLELGHAVDALSLEGGRRYARLGDQLLEIDAVGLDEPLAKSADEWRSRAWSSMQIFKVDTATFTLDGESLTIRRDSGEWLRTRHGSGSEVDGVKVDYTAASDALYPLTEVRAIELRDRAAIAGQPRLEILLTASDGVEERLELYAVRDDTAVATIEGRDAVLLLSAADAERVIQKVEALRDAEPLVEAESGDG